MSYAKTEFGPTEAGEVNYFLKIGTESVSSFVRSRTLLPPLSVYCVGVS